MPICACGCGGSTKGGTFLPGHDTRLRGQIERRVGGLLALARLVDDTRRLADGEIPPEDFAKLARKVFAAADAEGR